MDFTHYQPAPVVLERLKLVDFLAVIGPTAVGKDTVMAAAQQLQPALHEIVSTTSRAPRPGERAEVDYHFRTKADMLARIERGEFVQVAPTGLGEIYATDNVDYPTEGVAMLPVWAEAIASFRALPFQRMRCVYILPPSWEAWQERVATRYFTPEQLQARLGEAKYSLEFALREADMHFIVNDVLEQSAEQFINFALDKPGVQIDQAHATELVHALLRKLAL